MTWHALRLFGNNRKALDALDLVKGQRGGQFKLWQPMRRVYRAPLHGKPRKPAVYPLYPGWAFVQFVSSSDRYIVGCCDMAKVIGEIPDAQAKPVLDAGMVDEGFPPSRSQWRKGQKVRIAIGRIGDILADYEKQVGNRHVVRSPLFGGRDVVVSDGQIMAEAAE